MKRKITLMIAIVTAIVSFGQKIQGSYVGKILSERNVLLLEMDKNAHVTGTLYLNGSEHFNFKGTYAKPQLKGLIAIDSIQPISVEGNLKGSSLSLTFSDSVKKRIYIAHKISPKVYQDVAELYSEEHDMVLLGQWITFKKFDAYGTDITEQATMTYDLSLRGRGKASLGDLPAVIATSRGIVSTNGFTPPEWELDWETKKGVLYVTNRIYHLSVDNVYDYYIRNDTLITRLHINGQTQFWKRK